MHPEAHEWFLRRTFGAADWPAERLLESKGDTTVSVVLPARDEARTVGSIVEDLVGLRSHTGLIDEIIVMDSGSVDDTAGVAARAGASVFRQTEVLPAYGARQGKGEALWKSILVSNGDVIVFVDADLLDFQTHYVTRLIGPLLEAPDIALVKGFHRRSLGSAGPESGGRVTEIMARPVLNALFPVLSGVVQPLAGLQAARRSLLERMPFAAGYGVEAGLLIDTVTTEGLDALAQVELGSHRHRNQEMDALGRMAAAVFGAILRRTTDLSPWPTLTQFRSADGMPLALDHSVDTFDRPPWVTVVEYLERYGPTSGMAAQPGPHPLPGPARPGSPQVVPR